MNLLELFDLGYLPSGSNPGYFNLGIVFPKKSVRKHILISKD